MRRVMPFLLVLVGLLAFAPAVAGGHRGDATRIVREHRIRRVLVRCVERRPARTRHVYAEHQTTSSGETFTYACADQFTYNIRTGRGSGARRV